MSAEKWPKMLPRNFQAPTDVATVAAVADDTDVAPESSSSAGVGAGASAAVSRQQRLRTKLAKP